MFRVGCFLKQVMQVATVGSPGRVIMYGDLPPPGVWDRGGKARNEHKNMSIGKNLVPLDAILNSGNDFMFANSYFSNGASSQDFSEFRKRTPVSRAPHEQPPYGMSPPGKRISAVTFNDGSWGQLTTSQSSLTDFSPQRVPVNNRWGLSSSFSSPDLTPAASRRVLPQSAARFELDNQVLAAERSEAMVAEKSRSIAADKVALAEFPKRWGFSGTSGSALGR